MYSVTRVGFEPRAPSTLRLSRVAWSSGLKDRQPHQKSNGPCCARTGCAEWVRRRSNPRLRIFSPPLSHLSYRPQIGCRLETVGSRRLNGRAASSPSSSLQPQVSSLKKARCRGDTGLWRWSPNTAKVSQSHAQRDCFERVPGWLTLITTESVQSHRPTVAQILGGDRAIPLIQVATRIGTAPGTQAFAYET